MEISGATARSTGHSPALHRPRETPVFRGLGPEDGPRAACKCESQSAKLATTLFVHCNTRSGYRASAYFRDGMPNQAFITTVSSLPSPSGSMCLAKNANVLSKAVAADG